MANELELIGLIVLAWALFCVAGLLVMGVHDEVRNRC